MTFPLPIPPELVRRVPPGTGVLLGVSGGVDSAVTLALLHALGCAVHCVTFKNFCYGDDERFTDRSCCSLDAIEAARRLAVRFGAPHWVGDVEAPFRAAVIEPFVAEYRSGRTPNPCLQCNGAVRFPELVRLADRQGCSLAATGHYARVAVDGRTGRLLRGVDPAKDQSYFLHRVARDLWPRLVFPLGWYTKDEVRRAARELALPVADKPDSQEICFVPDDDRSFLFADGPGTASGPVVDRAGRELGRHRGLVNYTVGQRRGLGVAAAEPLYVLELDVPGNRLVVGARDELLVTRLLADRFVAALADLPAATKRSASSRVTR
ncbi:MAG: tRNA 2-thiouridine(34) synthase MnmA, partial [Krumholzibacteria bacterium]|nr:tRNA 2-thiouridine(34) synthase MnmA [Candidatus Krumholzibacteria bacterium]